MSVTPESIAQQLFSTDPKPPRSFGLNLADQDDVDTLYIFELVVTIMMEALNLQTNGFDQVDLDQFSEDHIMSLDEWFQSLGFNINVLKYDANWDYPWKDYYCRIKIRTPQTSEFFEEKGITKNYHFLVNPKSLGKNTSKSDLNTIYTVFQNGQDVYKIWFDHLPH